MNNVGRDLDSLVTATPDGLHLARGQVILSDAGLEVVVGGAVVPAHGLISAGATEGAGVLCARVGQQWYVLGATTSRVAPLPRTGKIVDVVPSSPTITIEVEGTQLEAPFVSGNGWTPAVDQQVLLAWYVGDPVPSVIGEVGSVPEPDEPPKQPPPPTDPTAPKPKTGRDGFPATDSGTYTITEGRWNDYHGRNLVQGSWGGRTYMGAWWYGRRPQDAMRGRTVTKAVLRLPARSRLGSYNQPVTIHLRLHHQISRGGRPTTTGRHDVRLPANYAGGWVAIPTSWGEAIASSGGGIAIEGEPYAGLTGVGPSSSGLDPASGQIQLSWRK